MAAIQKRTNLKPKVGIILGSGLNEIAEEVKSQVCIPYREIPHFHTPSVAGHVGQVVIGKYQDVPVVVLQGRFHYYEGYTMNEVALPTRTVCALGIETLILTNAAGAINENFKAGDLMIIEDHINLTGNNPLYGANLNEFGPRFPDLSEAYNRKFVKILEESAGAIGLPIHKGIYVGLMGPSYETPAEVRMLRTLGADAVGMSTVPESIAANHMGVKVVGISSISNLAAGLTDNKLTHDEVIENSVIAKEKLTKLLRTAIPKMV